VVHAGRRWFEIPRYVALAALVSLGLGAGAILLIVTSGLAQTNGSRVFIIAAGGFGLVALALTSFGRSRIRLHGPRLDEHSTEEFSFTIALAAMFAVDVLAVLQAGTRPAVSWILLGVAAIWVLLWWPALLRTFTATTTMQFAQDPATVFAFLSDFRNQERYMPNVELVEKLTGGPIGIGTRFLTRVHLADRVFEGVDRVTDYQQDTRYASAVEGSHRNSVGVATFERVPEGTLGSFRFTTTLSYSGALLGSGVRRWHLAERLSAQRRAAWTRVKAILDGDAPTQD
jgi:hypothetical protein